MPQAQEQQQQVNISVNDLILAQLCDLKESQRDLKEELKDRSSKTCAKNSKRLARNGMNFAANLTSAWTSFRTKSIRSETEQEPIDGFCQIFQSSTFGIS